MQCSVETAATMAAAACSRANLQLILASKREAAQLAAVEQLLGAGRALSAGHLGRVGRLGASPRPGTCCSHSPTRRVSPATAALPPPPSLPAAAAREQQAAAVSVLRGVVVRIKYGGAYSLLPVEQLFVAADGTPGLSVPSPEVKPETAALRVPLGSVSGTNSLADGQWEAAGQAEAAQLAALLRQRGQPLLLAEVGAAALLTLPLPSCRCGRQLAGWSSVPEQSTLLTPGE